MKEKIKDNIVDLLLDGVKEKLDSVKENYKWQKLFVSTGDFFVNNPDVLVKFEDDLYSVFSKDNLIRIAKRLKDKNGYDFSQLLHNELYDLMVSYEIPIMETETYIHHFMQVIITYLEENDSDKALEMFLGDMRKEIGTYFAALESKLELVLNQISNLNKEKITTYSIADIDAQIRRETKYKGMGLDFFKLDDEQFESKFQNSLNDTKIYVVGKSREETTYRILNELKLLLIGTDFENKTCEIIDFLTASKVHSKKELYTTSLHSFGRKEGTKIYNFLKDRITLSTLAQ